MSAIIPHNHDDNASPFDVIRRTDESGEWWSARDLMPLLGYRRWEDFRNAIERARLSIGNTGQDADPHASERSEPIGKTERVNYRLTRYGAYMAAMNGDVRKEPVASAQTYFAVQTHRAEMAQASGPVLPQNYEEALSALLDQTRANRELASRVGELESDNRSWTILASEWNDYSVRTASAILDRDPGISIGQNNLFKILRSFGMVDRKNIPYSKHKTHLVQKLGSEYTDVETGEVCIGRSQVRVTVAGLKYIHRRLGGTVSITEHITAERHASES